jgi:putative transposase
MSKLLRYYFPGNVYFVTAVTHERVPILIGNIDLLWRAFDGVKRVSHVHIIAWVVLPDHFHMIIDPHNNILSNLMQRIKMSFASNYRKRHGIYRGRVWQNRFWDHIIRNEDDMKRHIDYIHYNPVKHEYAKSPFGWKHTSIHEFFDVYGSDWGVRESVMIEGDFGE